MNRQSLWEIDATLKGRGFVLDAASATRYTGPIHVDGVAVEIAIDVRDADFLNPPRIELLDRAVLGGGVLPNLEQDDGLCYAAQGTLVLDRYEPGRSILACLEAAEKTLTDAKRGQDKPPVLMEFPAYWAAAPMFSLASVENPGRRWTRIFSRSAGPQFAFIADQDSIAGLDRRPGRALILCATGPLVPGTCAFPPDTVADFLLWLDAQGLGRADREAALQALADEAPVVVAGANGAVGVMCALPKELVAATRDRRVRKERLPEILRVKANQVRVERYRVLDASAEFLVERNLVGSSSLAGKRVAVLGCGTIGSHLAKFLVQAGAGTGAPLLLFDPDILQPGNLGRHLLGYADLGRNKAAGVADHLRSFHPSILVDARGVDALAARDQTRTCDLVLDATGTEAFSDALNARIIEDRRAGRDTAPVIHGWVFGGGIAAQCLLNDDAGFACYRCLRPRFGEPWRFDPRKNVKEETPMIAARCGDGAYFSFSVGAPVIAATMMLEMALDWAAGAKGSRFRNRTLDHIRGRIVKDCSPEPSGYCPACGGRKACLV